MGEKGQTGEAEFMDVNGFVRLPRQNINLKKVNIDKLYKCSSQNTNYNDLAE